MKRTLSLWGCVLLLASLVTNLFAFDAKKTYTIVNRNDASLYVQDNSTGGISMGSLNNNSYWQFEATGNTNCYYVKNATTGKYAQSCNGNEVEVQMGDTPVEYYIELKSEEGDGMYGLASTDQTTYNFTSGTIGWNWKGNNTVQGFAAVAGTNHRSFWKIVEAEMPQSTTIQGLSSPYEGVVPAVGNEFYLYNVKTGKWLGDNHVNPDGSWTSHGELGPRGRDIELKAGNADGRFILNPKLSNNESINGSNLYMDTNDGVTNWIFTPVDVDGVTNCYALTTPGGRAMGANANGWATSEPNDIAENGNIWQLVSRQQRLAAIQDGDDCSWLVLGGTFPVADSHRNQNTYNTWKGTYGDNANGGDGFYHCNRVWELWNISDRDIYQDIVVPNGKFKFKAQAIYVSTGNDGMNVDRYNEYLADPAANTKGVVYANDATTPMINVYSLVTNEKVNDRNTKEITSGVWAYNGTNEYSTNIYEGKGWTDEIEVEVINGKLRVGAKVENASSAWMLLDNFTLTYAGEVVIQDLTPIIAALNSMIDAAANFNGDTTDALAAALAQALSAAQNVDQTDADAMTNATNALEEALTKAQTVDVSVLRSTVAYIKAKGVDVSAQEDFLANGTTNDVNNQINAAVLALKFFMADKSTQPTIFTMISESVVGTDDNNRGMVVTDHADGFYAYNVGTGRWFCGGDDWGAHAAVGFPGIKFTTPEDNYNNGHYNGVVTWLFNGNWGDGGKLDNNGYCDTGGNAWKFWKKDAAQGIYTWSNNGNDQGVNESNGFGTKDLVGFSPSTYMRVDVHRTGDDDPYNQWIFVTEAQRDEMAANANPSATNPVDLTYKIKMPGFNQRERKEGTNQGSEELDWTCNHTNYRYDAADNGSRLIINGRGDNHHDFVCDVYGGQWNDAFSWKQTVTGLKPGNYRVKVQGYNNGGDDTNKACLVANGKTATLKERSSEEALPWTNGLPENTFDNPEYFQAGCYWNEVECTVGSNGELTLGVESPSVTGSHVIIFDNFRLEYLGAPYGINTMSIVGDFTNWDTTDPNNHMTMDENDPNIWTLTIDNFKVDQSYYEYKATANDTWGVYEKPAPGSDPANQNWQFGTDMYPYGYYKLVFTMNTETHELTLVPTPKTVVKIEENVNYVAEAATDVTIELHRTFVANNTWNTFCVPFNISNDDLKAVLGDDVAVAEYSETAEGENSTVYFNTMTTPAVTANVPVLVKTTKADGTYVFGGDIVAGEAKVEGTNFDFVGTSAATTTIAEGDYFLNNNTLYKSEGQTTIAGTRAYVMAKAAPARVVKVIFDGEDIPTGVEELKNSKIEELNSVYDLQGRKVNDQAKKGVYIQNGKKVVIK